MKKAIHFLLILCLLFPPLSSFASEGQGEAWEARSGRAEKWFFKDLPRHIGNDLKETFWNRWHLLLFAYGVAGTAVVHVADAEIQQAFQTERPFGKIFDDTMKFGFHPLVLGGATLVSFGIAKWAGSKKTAVTAGTMLEALVLTEALTVALQVATGRRRPDGSNNFSFPSGHTSGAFALATVAGMLYGPWVGIPAYTLASLVGVSRIDSNRHVASDVVAGALLGTLIGLGTAKFHKKEFKDYFLMPLIKENTSGIALVHSF